MALPLKFKPALGWKLILSVSALIVLTSITLGWFAGQNAVNLIKSGLMDRGRSLARNLAYNSEYGVLIANQGELSGLVDGVIREEDVLYAVVRADGDIVLAAAHAAQLQEMPPRTVERTALQGMSWSDPLTQAFQIIWAGETIYEIAYPIRTKPYQREREEIGLTLQPTLDRGDASGERTIGLAAVGMSLSLKRVNAAIISLWVSIGLLTGLVILAGIFVTILLAKVIAGPVKQLAEAARRIAEGDLRSHVEIKTRDEIGDLADSFNRMADSVHQREGELRAHANELDRLNQQLLNQQQELREINARLEASSRHKSQFLANMSHELRTPLNAILGFSGILLNKSIGKVSDQERQEFLTNIRTSGRHLLGLISEVLDLSKIEAGKVELNLESFSVSEVLEGVRQTIEPLAGKKNIAVEVTIDPKLCTLTADVVKFKQILYNLLSNAIKFTPETGSVHVHAQLADEWAEFSVRDTGIGIRPEDRVRIFQEFEQVEMSAERRYEGTGLGLTLAKKLVELLGGRIWVESEVGEGSTFVFVLPLNSRREAANTEMGSASSEYPS